MPKYLDILRLDLGNTLSSPVYKKQDERVHDIGKPSDDQTTNCCVFRLFRLFLEKEMATRSSVLAWRIPGTVEPGGLLSMGSHRVKHDWSDLAAAVAAADCFYFFTLINNTAMNICVQVFIWTYMSILFSTYLGSGFILKR